jgi:hypothetical protein
VTGIILSFIACSLIAQPGAKTPCREVNLPLMTLQAYGVIEAPVYFEAEVLNAANCQRNGEFEIAKWAVAHPHFVRPSGFKCAPVNQYAKIDL